MKKRTSGGGFQGSFVALATPFSREGAVDEAAYRGLVRWHLKSGTSGLVPCGSTGEAATLSHEESSRLISICVEEAGGNLPVVAGVGTNDTAKAAALCREAEGLGASAVLLLAPYYNKPTQEGIYQHFKAASLATRLPIVVYNIPGRTAVNILPSTLARLAADFPNIAAVKEASGLLDQVSEIMTLIRRPAPRGRRFGDGGSGEHPARRPFSVLSGDDSLTLPMMAVGAQGVVSVIANILPRETAELCAAASRGDWAKARSLHLKMFPLVKALFIETNPIPVKAALEMMGLCRGEPRLPLTPLTAASKAVLKDRLKEFGLL
ncbi:MAG: 4-hydroxy-tetrahydrodipicolinate synthase [Elusimicrobia bacterium]|nr:4-hydroxy-tetrahydrodipicolinate synthase [Elusimicrobiota bacterium]